VIVYLDTSAAAKLLVEEFESEALEDYLAGLGPEDEPVSSALLETELRRFGVRFDLSQALISDLLDRVDLVEPDRSLFTEAGLLPGRSLRSLDALHVATALRVDASVVVAYDDCLHQAARAVGLATAAPGQASDD
jgi:predicted nucleic acid-binding protein